MPSSPAHDPEFRDTIQRRAAELAKRGSYHSLELADGTVIPGMIGIDALKARIRSFPIPGDLRGKRVLDVGAASGWNSFEMERRGAEVMAVDCVEFEEFRHASKLLNSKVDYRVLDVDELTPRSIGRFDYVLFFGVLYHLRHPLLGLERICALTKEAAFVESFVTDDGPDPGAGCTLEFYETDELGGQIDNWFGPNTNGLMALCRSAGFARVVLEHLTDRRAGVTCYRHWEAAPAIPEADAPRIHAAVNNRTSEARFHPAKDEYVCLYFTTSEAGLTRDRIRAEIDGAGVPCIGLTSTGPQGWQANLKLPPFLDLGAHEVRLRTTGSAYSSAVAVWVGAEPSGSHSAKDDSAAEAPCIYAVESNLEAAATFHGYKNEYLCIWFRHAAPVLNRDDLIVQVDGQDVAVVFLGSVGEGRWQVNARLPQGLQPGVHRVRVRTGASPFSESAEIQFEPEA